MSRTTHHRGQKVNNCGRDLWAPGPTCGLIKCAENKRLGRRLQRKHSKAELLNWIRRQQ